VLVEWDNDIPPLAVLLEERQEAQRRLDRAIPEADCAWAA
jgi:hypothetical protein